MWRSSQVYAYVPILAQVTYACALFVLQVRNYKFVKLVTNQFLVNCSI